MTDLLADSTPPALDPNVGFFDQLVGPDKKFKDQELLAKAKHESDVYIKTLERQLDERTADFKKVDEELRSKAKLEEMLDQLAARQQTTNNQQPPVNVEKPVIDPQQIDSLITKRLQEIETNSKQQENLNLVGKTLKENLGDNYQGIVKSQLEELGLSEDDFHNMARTRPNFLLKALGADKPAVRETFQTPPRNAQRSDNFSPKGAQKRTWSFYQKMKRENPDLYRNPKTNVDMHNDLMAIGETAFYDAD